MAGITYFDAVLMFKDICDFTCFQQELIASLCQERKQDFAFMSLIFFCFECSSIRLGFNGFVIGLL